MTNWTKALTFAALPGAARVRLSRSARIEDGTPTTAYRLTSLDAGGETLGDDRDYDLLKAAMGPLERLAEAEPSGDFTIELDLGSGALIRS
ncbi:MAG: hypothetical protein AAF768_07225 [Pseudomonadota bacterium]